MNARIPDARSMISTWVQESACRRRPRGWNGAIVFGDAAGGQRRYTARAVGYLTTQDGHATLRRVRYPDDQPIAGIGFDLMFMGLAGLAIINSPAARREPVERHRGLARNLARQIPGLKAGGSTDLMYSSVAIGWHGEGEARGPSGASHPKAYHFCRAHMRERGGISRPVRAHWRGDPAFGTRLPSYRVLRPLVRVE